jgi:hypothetical protein
MEPSNKPEVSSLINDFKCLFPEEIDYDKDYDCIHAAIYLKIKCIDKTTIVKLRQECVDVAMSYFSAHPM